MNTTRCHLRKQPPARGSSSSSFHRILFLLLTESSNFEKKNMSFCQIRRDSLWSVLRSVRTQSQPLTPGPRRAAGPPTPASCASPGPETQRLARLKLSKGQASSSSPPRPERPCGETPGPGGLFVSLYSPRPRLQAPLAPTGSSRGGLDQSWAHLLPHRRWMAPLFPVCEYSRGVHQAPLPCGPRALSVLQFGLSGRPPTLPQEPHLQGFPKSQPCW